MRRLHNKWFLSTNLARASVQLPPAAPPPAQATAAGALANQSYETGTGTETVNTALDFTPNGNTLMYSVNAITGVAIDSATGVLTIDLAAVAAQAGTTVIVTATDTYGRTTQTTFQLTVTEPAPEVVPETTLSREYNSNSGTFTVDLSQEGPAEVGVASYAVQGSAPAGVTLSGATLSYNSTTAAGGVITVRRTDDNGNRDFVVTFSSVTFAVVDNGGGVFTFTGLGDDTPDSAAWSFTITGGDYDGETVSGTYGELRMGAGEAILGTDPVIGFQTDADGDNLADENDVLEVTRPSLMLYNPAFAAPTRTADWRDIDGSLGVATATYTASALENTTITYAESVGAVEVVSSGITVGTTSGGGGTDLSPRYVDSLWLDFAQNTTLTSTFAKTDLTVGNNLLVMVTYDDLNTTAEVSSVGLVGDTAVTTPALEQNPGGGDRWFRWFLVPITASPGDLEVTASSGEVINLSVEIFEIPATFTLQNSDVQSDFWTTVSANITDVVDGISIAYSWSLAGVQELSGVTAPTSDADGNTYAPGTGTYQSNGAVGSDVATAAGARALSSTGDNTLRFIAASVWA